MHVWIQVRGNKHICLQQMNKILNLLLLACLASLVSGSIYSWTIKTSVDGTPVDIEYSPDQKYVAIATTQQVILYDGVTIYPWNRIGYDTIYEFSCFAFSQDSSQFAAAFKAGDGTTLVKIYRTDKAELVEEFRVAPMGSSNAPLTVYSLCWTADNTRIVYGTSEGNIFSWRLSDKNLTNTKFSDTALPQTVACSPTRSLEFSVAGSNTEGKQSKFTVYTVDAISNAIDAGRDLILANPDETINSIVYSTSGAFVYRAGSVSLYKTKVDSGEETDLKPVTGLVDFVKIRVSYKEDIIAVSTKDLTLYTIKWVPDANARIEQVQSIKITGFGLAPHGLNQMFMQTTSMATVASQCKINQILNQVDGTCINCDASCKMCFGAVNLCKLCREAYYLSPTTCLQCIDRCKDCTNGNSCATCYEPFVLRSSNQQCGCPDGKYINLNQCSACPEGCLGCTSATACTSCADDYELENGLCETKGFPTWAIVLLILLGLSIVVVISGVIFVRVRRQKRSPLLTDSDEAAAQQ